MASENVIWGTTAYEGNKTCNCGTVFKLTKSGSSWNETVVHRFIGGTHDGANPFTAPTVPELDISYTTPPPFASPCGPYNPVVPKRLPLLSRTTPESGLPHRCRN
jgi:hypothetical protein